MKRKRERAMQIDNLNMNLQWTALSQQSLMWQSVDLSGCKNSCIRQNNNNNINNNNNNKCNSTDNSDVAR